jgi:hypothetical protein
MGMSYQYTCEGCGYEAQVSGGRDVGMMAVVRTMFCRGCRELVDVLIGQCGLDGPTGDADYDKALGICPECRGDDVVVWKDGRPCPRCEGRMVKGEDFILWD